SEKGNTLFKEGGLGKIAMHTSVGGVMAALNKQDFLKGAILGGIHESISPLRGNPLENTEKQILISKVYGAILGGLLGGESLMEFGSRLSESAERYNAIMHAKDGKVMIIDRVNDAKAIELTEEGEEKIREMAERGEYGITKDNTYGKDVYVLEGSILEVMKEFINDKRYVKEVLDVNNKEDFEALRSKTNMNYVNIHPNTSIVFINGMGNTLEDAQESTSLIQRNFPNQQVGLINNATKGLDKDVLEYKPNTLTLTDFLNAQALQRVFRDSKESIDSTDSTDSKVVAVLAHSRGVRDINNANVINAHQGFTATNYKLIPVGSPISESELIQSTASVGA
ncbi:MAG: hypothetical protein K2I63_02860, partial [Helicobacter sp.]|nr:hypothetical protein [Helicobacter sp.]